MNAVWNWLRRLRPRPITTRLAGAALGSSGERVAEAWLCKRGYRVIERNFSIGKDEIDLLMREPDGRTLVLVEVKTRSRAVPVLPEESVGTQKQRRLVRLAARLQQSAKYRDSPIRIDVVSIIWPEGEIPQVKHIPSAFDSPY